MAEDVRITQASNIPVLRATGGELLPEDVSSKVVLSSASTKWRNFVLEEHRFFSRELGDSMYIQHVIAVNVGPPIICHLKIENRIQRVCKPTGTVFLAPSHSPFFRYCRVSDDHVSADVLYVAIDPVFVSQTAASLDVYPDRVELSELQRPSDPAVWHIAMALRAGVRAGHTNDGLYGESLSTALAVHLLREYAGLAIGLQYAHAGLPREKLVRAIEYIQDQLNTNLTVSGIARTVHLSPHHFTTVFKKATGQSPYRYVIEARARKAKELLQSGKFSIADVAYQVGFADQSHLTRHFKHFFGITPKMFVQR
jgi:AraC family transcriptional regulator